jgi:sialate O-acetylesterase
VATLIGTIAAASAARAQVQPTLSLGPLFQDHAVLQRDKPIAVWGTSGPRDEVTVAFAGTQTSARADGSGRWTVTLPATGGGGPHSLEVRTTAGATRTLSDVLVGDVFLCSGQSNMEFGVAQSRGGEMVVARAANDRIRLVSVAHAAASAAAATFDQAPVWQSASPESVRRFSAACYYFGREIHEMQKVPVGLVNASWGGAAIEPWISDAGLRAIGGFDARLDMLRVFSHDEDAANQRA